MVIVKIICDDKQNLHYVK